MIGWHSGRATPLKAPRNWIGTHWAKRWGHHRVRGPGDDIGRRWEYSVHPAERGPNFGSWDVDRSQHCASRNAARGVPKLDPHDRVVSQLADVDGNVVERSGDPSPEGLPD